jgi:hypothetical protein
MTGPSCTLRPVAILSLSTCSRAGNEFDTICQGKLRNADIVEDSEISGYSVVVVACFDLRAYPWNTYDDATSTHIATENGAQKPAMVLFIRTSDITEALASVDAAAAWLLSSTRVNHKNSISLKPDCLKPLFTVLFSRSCAVRFTLVSSFGPSCTRPAL